MYENGIAQVEEGLFSQTLAFDDISYQSAREESQQAIFSGWCQLFDYFGGGELRAAFRLCNLPIPTELIGRKRFFGEDDPATAAYAAEYNRILNDKMREGVSNLVRERYLTFSVGAASDRRGRAQARPNARHGGRADALEDAQREPPAFGRGAPGRRYTPSCARASPTRSHGMPSGREAASRAT